MSSQNQTRSAMNAMYRRTRYIYDASRKYYLLGRDHLIERLNAQPGEIICEIGCGTARNLVKMVKRYPKAHFFGIDASDEMLKSAQKKLRTSKEGQNIQIAQGLAQDFNPETLFGITKPLDKIVFSYSLSIIPLWRESIDHALSLLERGGTLHIVDFGAGENLPHWFRRLLFWWLGFFHVYYKPETPTYLKSLENGNLEIENLYRGYAYYAVFTKR